MKNRSDIRWTLPTADAYILTASGSPLNNPLNVPAYLLYVLNKRGLQEICQRGTQTELQDIHILLCAQVFDGSLSQVSDEMLSLFTFAAMKIAEMLCKLTGQEWFAFEPRPREKAA